MAVRSYVASRFFAAFSADDIRLVIAQELSSDSRYEIEQPKSFIAEKIYSILELTIHENYTYNSIRRLFETDGRYSLALSSGSSAAKIILTVDNVNNIYAYDQIGDVSYRRVYEVYHVDDSKLCYLAADETVAPDKNVELSVRCYHEYFTDLAEAEAYCRNEMKAYAGRGTEDSGFRIFAADAEKISVSEWYNKNIVIAESIKRYGLDRYDYCAGSFADIEMAVKADAYDDLSEDEQFAANKYLCELLLPFIDDMRLEYINSDIDSISDFKEMECLADDMILCALLSAKSEEEFEKVHNALGPYGYRIGALTDDMYNDHPYEGGILMCSDGQMRWYSDIFSLNEWDGAKDNPYFGKFQPNENNDLLCLREYHPELIVDTFPSAALIRLYKENYLKELAEKKRMHPEMQLEVDNEIGFGLCIGDWYPDGVFSEEYVRITFPIIYETYSFSKAQCRQLLSGEEIIIPNYVSKMGRKLSIRGKLKETFNDEYKAVFTRTDINTRERNIMNAALGVIEAGLPPIE